jgi:hypothetical protein|tara:strand:- start:650 stop:1441 length:792 start_codon:yes stop_codon:yes gene_type:complete
MKHQKRAEGRTLIIMIIVIASALILIPFAGKLYAMIVSSASDDACRLSIFAQAKLKNTLSGTSAVSVECQRKNIIFYNDHVEEHIEEKPNNIKVKIGDKPEEKFEKLDDNIVNQVIAEELRKCWYKTGEGKLDAFAEGGLLGTNTCLLCATIEFDDSVKDKFTGLVKYLEDNSISINEEEKTYFNYLSTVQTSRGFLWIPKEYKSLYLQVDEIIPDQRYSIFMKSFKTGNFMEKIWQFPDTYFILIGPTHIMSEKNVCDNLLN